MKILMLSSIQKSQYRSSGGLADLLMWPRKCKKLMEIDPFIEKIAACGAPAAVKRGAQGNYLKFPAILNLKCVDG